MTPVQIKYKHLGEAYIPAPFLKSKKIPVRHLQKYGVDIFLFSDGSLIATFPEGVIAAVRKYVEEARLNGQ